MIDLPGPDALIYAGAALATLSVISELSRPYAYRIFNRSERNDLWPYLQEPMTEEKCATLREKAYASYLVNQLIMERNNVTLKSITKALEDPIASQDGIWWVLTGGGENIYPSQI